MDVYTKRPQKPRKIKLQSVFRRNHPYNYKSAFKSGNELILFSVENHLGLNLYNSLYPFTKKKSVCWPL